MSIASTKPVYRKTSDTSHRLGAMERDLEAWVEIPPRRETEPEPEPEIKDPHLRKLYERSKAREERRASPAVALPTPDLNPVRATEMVKFANGRAMTQTAMSVCARPDISSKAKIVAMALALHAPHVKPSIPRLMLLTSIRSNTTICRALIELRDKGLLSWKPGKSAQANEYTCLWLSAV